MRLIADYRGTPLDDEEAALQVDRAEEFLRLVEKHLTE
jgi:hypothetical protein